jgi:beta-phosphoglucomutase
MATIKAVIFDMDGVLLDAREWHYNALRKALNLFGYDMNRYDHIMKYDGLPTRKKLEMYSKEYELPVKLHDFINELKQSFTIDEIYQNAKPNFQHELLLSQLKNEGLKLALASNSINATVQLAMEKVGLLNYFDSILSNQDISKPKPDPEMYLKTMTLLNVQPEETLIIEDNENGVQAALASGAFLLRVNNPSEVRIDSVKKRIKEVEHD